MNLEDMKKILNENSLLNEFNFIGELSEKIANEVNDFFIKKSEEKMEKLELNTKQVVTSICLSYAKLINLGIMSTVLLVSELAEDKELAKVYINILEQKINNSLSVARDILGNKFDNK